MDPTPEMLDRPRRGAPTLRERFFLSVEQGDPDDCWPWKGTLTTRRGYGQVGIAEGTVRAHRLSWVLAYGPIPASMSVCHRCDNPPCCNPAHLFLGTWAENQHDKGRKGRAAKGEANGGGGKLTEGDVREIRVALATGESCTAVARRFGVSRTMIGYIQKGVEWSHVA